VLDKKCFQFIRVLKTKNVYYYVIPFGLYKIDILLGYTLQHEKCNRYLDFTFGNPSGFLWPTYYSEFNF